MITKGILTSIDYNNNTCSVRVPTFEMASAPDTQAVFFNVAFMNMPGIYNGYKAGDVVFVAFENGNITFPVVVGKLYLGTKNEAQNRGIVSCENLNVTGASTIPITTKLSSSDSLAEALTNSSKTFGTIKDIADLLQEHDSKITSLIEFNNNNFYQSGEIVIGNWIDNKPIYRKTFVINHDPVIATGESFSDYFSINTINYDNIWQDLSHTMQIGDRYTLNTYCTPTQPDYFNCYIDKTTNRVYYRGYAPDNISKHIITLEYTKK